MATYEEAYNANTDKAKAARAKYGSLEKFTTAAKAYNAKQATKKPAAQPAKKKATETANNERIASVVNKTNQKAKGGAVLRLY